MSVICSLVHSTDMFTWSKDTKSFAAEDSDFGRIGDSLVFDDACDYGFWLESSKTGKKELCIFHKYEYDAEGEVTGWIYYHYDPHGKRVLSDWTVTIFND